MASTEIFATFMRNLVEALNQRLADNAHQLMLRTGTYNRPRQYLVTDASSKFFEIRKNYHTVVRLENQGFVNDDESILVVQVVGTGNVHSPIFAGRNTSEADMTDAVDTVLRLDQPP